MTNLIHNLLLANKFSHILLKWNNEQNKRQMPWKGEKNAYKIWLSEIILQQTRVEQGLKYYEKFITAYPTISQLAAADEKEVFKLWEGLGYYSRCRNLIATAKHIAQNNKGIFPAGYNDILSLKGIGAYTAAAIASFAYNLPHAVVDGNVYRVLARVFGIDDAIDTTSGKKKFAVLAQQLLPKKNAGQYNQAIMDFGATICKPMVPLCPTCVYNKYCVAYNQNKINHLPVKQKKLLQKTRWFYFFITECDGFIACRERTGKDIWRHLYEFPLIESEEKNNVDAIIAMARAQGWVGKAAEVSEVYVQKLTHQTIHTTFIQSSIKKRPNELNAHQWVAKNELHQYPFPRVINSYLLKSNYIK